MTDHGNYVVQENYAKVVERPGKSCCPSAVAILKAGEPILRGYFDTGDHVFVDKLSYHFMKPGRGDVFVFNTETLPTGENRMHEDGPSQFYIKRLAGLPGDTLRIDPPRLLRQWKARGRARLWPRDVRARTDTRGTSNGIPLS